MAVDLHSHSHFSDGSDSPTEIVEQAAAMGLSGLALTDHDNLDGIEEARRAADRTGVNLIAGIELSCEWELGGMHMLVYFLEPGEGALQNRLAAVMDSRNARNANIIAALNDMGIEITLAEVETEGGGTGIGRPHIAQVLVTRGAVESIPEAFDRYLAKGRPAYVNRDRLGPEEAIQLATASGAVTSIAHPHTLGLASDDVIPTLSRLHDIGLTGLESHYSEYDPIERGQYVALAESVGLVATGGSDYHGAYKAGLSLGNGFGDLDVPDYTIERLGDRIPHK